MISNKRTFYFTKQDSVFYIHDSSIYVSRKILNKLGITTHYIVKDFSEAKLDKNYHCYEQIVYDFDIVIKKLRNKMKIKYSIEIELGELRTMLIEVYYV